MEIKLIFGVASTVLSIAAFGPYLYDIFKGNTKPHMYSWLVWAILQTIGAIAQVRDGAGYGALVLTLGAVICVSIFILSFKYGTKDISVFDKWCLFFAIGAIILYFFLHEALLSVILISIVDFVGFLPTYRKTFNDPSSELWSAWALAGGGYLASIIAMGHYSAITLLYTLSAFIGNFILVSIILIRRKKGSQVPF